MWLSFVDKIYLINLPKREDRLIYAATMFDEYQIPYYIFPAIENVRGAEGLRDTMNLVFQEAADNNYENILVFEDDAKFVADPETVHSTMNKVVNQLPENYHLCYLGGQPTAGYSHFHSDNLLPALKYFATHSVMYSKQGIHEILSRGMDFPIDNWIVDKIQTLGFCYAIHPLLCTQRAGFSDIGKTEMDWGPFILPKHEQKVNQMRR